MNFLLHRRLGARDLASAVAGIGAMLPDLWRMADRRVRPSERLRAKGTADETIALLLRGIQHHVVADRWFHADEVFVAGEREAIRLLTRAKIEARHMRLFGHVMWELCLDGELIRRDGTGETLNDLRVGFDSAGASVREATEIHRLARSGASTPLDERKTFERDLDRIRDGLVRGPWVTGYASAEGIAERIGGVRVRLGLAPLHTEDAGKLARVADELLDRAVPAVSQILAREPSTP